MSTSITVSILIVTYTILVQLPAKFVPNDVVFMLIFLDDENLGT